jgi:hypothetical protein
LFGCLKGHKIGHLYVAAKAHHLVTNGVFEAENNAHRYQHHCQTHSYASYGDAYGRAVYPRFVGVIGVNALSKEKG